MYESFFDLHRRPFSATPDPSCVYLAGPIQTVLDELVVCLERGEGIAVLTAPAGFGKTLLCEKVRQELGPRFVTILLRHGNFPSPAELLQTLLAELGTSEVGDSEPDLRRKLHAALAERRRRGELLVIVCDEAHHLPESVLEELRQWVDYADHGVPWVRVMLAGQLELEETLAGPEMSAFNQRLRSHVTLSPLTTQEALDYIDYRVTWAGGRTEEIFHPDALTAIVEAADGVPRCLNQLCDHVLLLAYVAEQRPAGRELVREALADLQHLPLMWNLRPLRAPEVIADVTDQEPASAEEAVDFGSHLSAWESSPTFCASDAAPEFPKAEVWETGADLDAAPAAEGTIDPLGTFLERVETELDRREASSPREIVEVPVVDRYAAIDGGWSDEELNEPETAVDADREPPKTERPAPPVPVEYPPSRSLAGALPTMPLAHEPDEALHAEVLELVSATQEALRTRRIDGDGDVVERGGHDASSDRTEATAPRSSSQRPFRNLFTRLRRKQKGLE
jgi:type II secretory pathway predicted ATPase ExeA